AGQRRPDAQQHGTHRPVSGPGLLHQRLSPADDGGDIEKRTRKATPAPPAALWEYAPAPESRDVVRIQDRYGLYVGGQFREPKSGRYFETIDPSTEDVLAEVAEAGDEDVALAVEAAREAYERRWSGLPG